MIWLIPIVVVPYLLVSCLGRHEWIGRLIAIGLVILVVMGLIAWYSLNPRAEVIPPSALLSKPGYESAKQKVSIGLRVFYLLIGVVVARAFLVPFSRDIVELRRHGSPQTMTRTIAGNLPLFGAWFLYQPLRMAEQGKPGADYYLLYSFKPVRAGKQYRFTYLPRSRLILMATEINH